MRNEPLRTVNFSFYHYDYITKSAEGQPEGYTSRTLAYFFLTMITAGIYGLVASICNLVFDPKKERNIGYKKD